MNERVSCFTYSEWVLFFSDTRDSGDQLGPDGQNPRARVLPAPQCVTKTESLRSQGRADRSLNTKKASPWPTGLTSLDSFTPSGWVSVMYRSMKPRWESTPALRCNSLSRLKEIKGSTESSAQDSSALCRGPLKESRARGRRKESSVEGGVLMWRRNENDRTTQIAFLVQFNHTHFPLTLTDSNRDSEMVYLFLVTERLNV